MRARFTEGVEVIKKLQEAGYIAVFAGGCVRDMLSQTYPNDFDVATNATPDQVIEIFGEKTCPVGKSFGVVLVTFGPGVYIEVATFRRDGNYSDGRHPENVELLTNLAPEEAMRIDASRRDFTINAMFHDPIAERTYDFYNSKRDLNNGMVRFVGNPQERIKEDSLRALRFFRFRARFKQGDFNSHNAALTCIEDGLKGVSIERIAGEFYKIITIPSALRAIDTLKNGKIDKLLGFDLSLLHGVPQDPIWHPEGNVYIHTIKVMQNVPCNNLELRLAAMFHDFGKIETTERIDNRLVSRNHAEFSELRVKRLLTKLKVSKNFFEEVTYLVRNHMVPLGLLNMRKCKIKEFISHKYFQNLMILHYADKMGSNRDLQNYNRIQEYVAKLDTTKLPEPLINGNDLIQYGIQGKEIGIIKKLLFEKQLNDEFFTKEEGLQLLTKLKN